METQASIRRHPIHPMLVSFPIALWIGSFVCDFLYSVGEGNLLWRDMAFYMMAGGVVGALAAAIPGFVDFLALRNREAQRIAAYHMALNLGVVALFVFNLGVRLNVEHTGMVEMGLSLLGIAVLAASGWLGGRLVYIHHVGVSEAGETHREKDEHRRAA